MEAAMLNSVVANSAGLITPPVKGGEVSCFVYPSVNTDHSCKSHTDNVRDDDLLTRRHEHRRVGGELN